jgi:ubiquinone/menaquinone biosynthesis C-methylase UbiE
MELLRPWMMDAPARTVLDVGCGTGVLRAFLREWGVEPWRYAGVDASSEMLRAGRMGGMVAGTADTVVSASSFHYWPEPRAGLREMRRVLAPGGRVLLMDWARDFASMRAMDAWLRVTGHALVRTYAEREGRAMLEEAGLRVTRSRRGKIGAVWGLWVAEARGD